MDGWMGRRMDGWTASVLVAADLKIHVGIHGREIATVFHSPFELHNTEFPCEVLEEGNG